MKKFYFAVLMSVTCLGIFAANAAEPIQLPLSVPQNLIQDACKTPAWKGLTVVWNGVKDKRTSPEIGIQTQKGKESIPVVSTPPLDQVFDSALKNIFTTCGMNLQPKGDDNILTLSAEIRDFYVGVEKKLLTGKSEAKSSIAFSSRKGTSSTSVTVGYEIESKNIRSGNIKQLQKTLDELFAETLKQIPSTEEMRDLK